MNILSTLSSKKFWIILASLFAVIFLLYVFIPWFTSSPIKDSTKIYDSSGTLLYEIHSSRATSRESINIEKLPKTLLEAVVAGEDKNFYAHHGIDIEAVGRALFQNAASGSIESGASTITSQVVKQLYYSDSSRSFLQKARETVASPVFEIFHTKNTILETYLNHIYFGNKSYGIVSASNTYFGKTPEVLSLSETAYLAGLIPSPENYNPYKYPERAKQRQEEILNRMQRLGFITEEEEQEALILPITLSYDKAPREAPHFVDYVIQEVKKTYPDLEEGNYKITTTLNLTWQKDAESVVKKQIEALRDRKISNGAMVVIEPSSGKVRVLLGSKDYDAEDIDGKFNVTTAKRQPGSSLKPFTYLTYFMQGASPSDVVYDIESDFITSKGDKYSPKNYDLKYHGPVSLSTALGSSLNIIAVKVLDTVGFHAFYDTLKHFGMTFANTPDHYGLGITLGGGEVRLIDLTHAYSMLANGGLKTEISLIEKIEKDGQVLFTNDVSASGSLFPEQQENFSDSVYLINHVLRDNNARSLSFGTANRLDINEYVAVKTGTTKDYRDNWALGYTPRIAVGVWVGNNDNTPMEGVSGITGAIPIWSDFLRRRENEITNIDESEWKRSANIIEKRICTTSGLLATTECPESTFALFTKKNAPIQTDTWYKKVPIDIDTGLLANASCTSNTVEKVMVFFPTPLLEWAESVHIPQAPLEYCDHTKVELIEKAPLITHPRGEDTFFIDTTKPLSAQQIPIKVTGRGTVSMPLKLDNQIIAENFTLPFVFFMKPSEGSHVIQLGTSSVQFTIKQQ